MGEKIIHIKMCNETFGDIYFLDEEIANHFKENNVSQDYFIECYRAILENGSYSKFSSPSFFQIKYISAFIPQNEGRWIMNLENVK